MQSLTKHRTVELLSGNSLKDKCQRVCAMRYGITAFPNMSGGVLKPKLLVANSHTKSVKNSHKKSNYLNESKSWDHSVACQCSPLFIHSYDHTCKFVRILKELEPSMRIEWIANGGFKWAVKSSWSLHIGLVWASRSNFTQHAHTHTHTHILSTLYL